MKENETGICINITQAIFININGRFTVIGGYIHVAIKNRSDFTEILNIKNNINGRNPKIQVENG